MPAGPSAGSGPVKVGFAPLWKTTLVALPAAALYGFGLYALMTLVEGPSGMALLAFLLGMPMASAALVVVIADPKGRAGVAVDLLIGAGVVTLLLVAASVVLREGAICVVMASPLFYGAGVGSAGLTGMLLRRGGGTRHLSLVLIACPLLGTPAESRVDYPAWDEAVSTVVDIDAPPAVVWRNTIEIRHIQPRELHWTFTQDLLGVPKPQDARLDGAGVGAVRQLRWGRGVRFQEVVADWRPQRRVTWVFRFDREGVYTVVDRHIRLDRDYLKLTGGDYELTPLPGGRTRLRLTTHYRVKAPVPAYWAWWGRTFLSDFHGNVLGVIKTRSQAVSAGQRGAA
jgi:hypothetical protein